MRDTTETSSITERPSTDQPRAGKLMSFTREHPALSVMGAAGVGLLGGFELAAGVLLGAGIIAIADRRDGRNATPEAAEAVRTVRQRAQRLLDRAPKSWRDRARAVIQAARGKLQPLPQQQASQAPTPSPSQPASDPTLGREYGARDEFAEDAELGIPPI